MSPVCFSSSSTSIVTSYPDGFTDISAEAAVHRVADPRQ